jgi:hypothetical protein
VDQELVLVISIQVSDSPAFVSERIIANALIVEAIGNDTA